MTRRVGEQQCRGAGIAMPTVRAALLLALLCLLSTACAPGTPEPLVRHQTAPNPVIDPARPCTGQALPGPPVPAAAPTRVSASLDSTSNTVVLSAGTGVTLSALSRAVGNPAVLREVAPGEWLLTANIEVRQGTSLQIASPEMRWLKLSSGPAGFVAVIALGGGVDVNGSCVTSWDEARGQVDGDHLDGRSFLLARSGGRMLIQHAELHYLGHGEVESYGLAWRTGSTGGITASIVSHLFYGLYSFDVDGLVVQDNEFHDNVLYGIDPHTRSRHLLIERNTAHHNGKHGIILAEDCTDSVVRDNVVYNNQHHGIVLYLNSDRNIVEGNDSFANAALGVNINESSGNALRGNRVYDNTESGIGVGHTAQDNLVEDNQVRGNQQDGIRLVSEATRTTVRRNVIGENVRYGVYVDGDHGSELVDNTIFGNRIGVMLRGTAATAPPSGNRIFGNVKGDISHS
jgi:parallel beta-helix repeat protein